MSFFHSFALMVALYALFAPPIMFTIYRYAPFLRDSE